MFRIQMRYGMDEAARWLLFGFRWSLGRDVGMQVGLPLRCDMEWMRRGSLGCDIGMRMIAEARCWSTGDGDH